MAIIGCSLGVVITLSAEEAEKCSVDHGEMELVIPLEDSLRAYLELCGALRLLGVAEEVRNEEKEEEKPPEVIDLMQALKASLAATDRRKK